MKDRSALLRLCFIIGAITDGLAMIPMLLPQLGAALFGGDFSRLGVEYRYAMGIGASLMAGWTALLIWGSIKPMERRGILVLTIFPVVTGIVGASIYGIQKQVIEFRRTIPLLIHLSLVSILYVYAYLKTRVDSRERTTGRCS